MLAGVKRFVRFESEEGFDSPVDAICNFMKFLIEEADEMMEVLTRVSCDEYKEGEM